MWVAMKFDYEKLPNEDLTKLSKEVGLAAPWLGRRERSSIYCG